MGVNNLGKPFVLLWLSETAFEIGGALLGFSLGVWIFDQHGSVREFSNAILASTIPALISIPFAGPLADRYDRRWVIGGCDLAALITVLIVAILLSKNMLHVEHLYVVSAVSSFISALRTPSYQAAVAQIVPQEVLGRANGIVNGSHALLQIAAPLTAGYLMAAWGLAGVMLIDVVMSSIGALLVFAALTSASHAIRGAVITEKKNIFVGIKHSYANVGQYFRENSLMIGLGAYVIVLEALLGLASTMFTPLVMISYDSDTLGIIMTLGAVGGVAGAVTLAVANFKTNLMRWVLVCDAGMALTVMTIGLVHSSTWWALCAFLAFALAAMSNGCSTVLWMRKVPKDRQGSVFACIGATNLITVSIVMLAGSRLVEQIFEPLMLPDGVLAQIFGAWVGVGKGRGISLLFILLGATFALVSLIAMLHPRLRKLDDLVPDQAKVESADEENANSSNAQPVATSVLAPSDSSRG